jgi:hypothetical protein
VGATELDATLDLSGKTVTLPAASVTAHVTQFDDNTLKEEIALLGFRTAANGSLAKYNLVDQTIDAFEDASGVDTGTSTGEFRSGSAFYSGAEAVNYLGDGSDGALTTSGNVTHTVTTPNGSYDGDMVLKQYTTLTISAGHTMTVSQPCRGMFIYVQGDCTINGTLSMTGKGALADPTVSGGSDSNAVGASGLQLGLISSGSSTFTNDGTGFNGAGTTIRTALANQANLSGDGTIFSISKTGGAGGAGAGPQWVGNGAVNASSGTVGTAGATGAITLSLGGGGGGGTWQHHGCTGGPAGAGGTAGAFSGGSGGGSCVSVAAVSGTGNAGANYGGAGGNAKTDGSGPHGYPASGGAGNPGGTGLANSNVPPAPTTGVGGILWLIVGGTLTIGAAGSITAQGGEGAKFTDGGASENTGGSSGGSSGGGAIFALSGSTFTNSGTISAAGGIAATTSGTNHNGNGGAGGAGGVHSGNLFTGDTYGNMTLVSTANTANDGAPTKGDLVATYTNHKGTASVGTDLKFYISRDGTNYTGPITMTSQGTTGGHTILTAHDVNLTSTSGTSMKWKIETLNQSASKVTRIHGISLGWS